MKSKFCTYIIRTMKRILEYKVTPEESGCTLRNFLLSRGYSNSVLVLLKKTPYSILVNGEWYYVNDSLYTDDHVKISIEENQASKNIIPSEIPLNIVYEDEDILVINKPANLPVHPSMNHYGDTLANGVMHYYATQNIPYVFRCINRLDRDTTGLTVLAKHALSGGILSREMIHKGIRRTYVAIVAGIVAEYGTISAPIAREEGSAIKRIVDEQRGDFAVTHFYRIAAKDNLSLIALQLETGRTHQIRVHMQHIGHPLIGDFLYNPGDTRMNRQALHSFALDFQHPITKISCHFDAPLPKDMTAIFDGDYSPQYAAAYHFFLSVQSNDK